MLHEDEHFALDYRHNKGNRECSHCLSPGGRSGSAAHRLAATYAMLGHISSRIWIFFHYHWKFVSSNIKRPIKQSFHLLKKYLSNNSTIPTVSLLRIPVTGYSQYICNLYSRMPSNETVTSTHLATTLYYPTDKSICM